MSDSKGHIGYKVQKLDEWLEKHVGSLGGEVVLRATMPDSGNRIAFVRIGDMLVEMVEPADAAVLGGVEGPVYEHVAIHVADLDGTIASLAATGVLFNPPVPRSSVMGGRTTFASLPALGGSVQFMGD